MVKSGAIAFWKRASADLEIEIVTPFVLTLPDGYQLEVSALVRNFGTARGMLVADDYELIRPLSRKIVDQGYGYSTNMATSPVEYNRSSLIDVLRDWGWCGPQNDRPAWLIDG